MAHSIVRIFPGQKIPVLYKPFPFYNEVLCQNFLVKQVIKSESHPGSEGSTIYYLDGSTVPISQEAFNDYQAQQEEEEEEYVEV